MKILITKYLTGGKLWGDGLECIKCFNWKIPISKRQTIPAVKPCVLVEPVIQRHCALMVE